MITPVGCLLAGTEKQDNSDAAPSQDKVKAGSDSESGHSPGFLPALIPPTYIVGFTIGVSMCHSQSAAENV